MQVNGEHMLDQLWFTWSTSGLGSMPMGFRVRAASEGLYDIQGMYYRRVNRFVNYELPQGVSASEFSPNIAPISLSLVNNGEERLLIRKVYTGLDAVGRNGAFFTHLIAGLPRDFTARDAIRLWYCPELWRENEEGKATHDKNLEKIRYSDIRSYADHPQASFNVASVSDQLQNLLLLILTKGLPQRILVRGHSTMIAPLIYGLTHALPMKLLPGLTFTTYESNAQESETLITGTINGAELNDITRIQVQPGQATGPIPADLHRYVFTAVNALQTGSSIEKLSNVINEIDRRDHATVEDLIELFNRRFRHGPLKSKQLEDTVLYPADNLEDLADPTFQMDAVQLLLDHPDYWKSRGKQVFQQVVNRLTSGAQSRSDQQARESLTRYVNGTIDYLFSVIQTALSQGMLPSYAVTVVGDIAHPSRYPTIYLRMLTEFAKEPIYRAINTNALWGFQFWLLSCARLMQPLPAWEQILPWLHIPPNWDKLEDVLRLDLPVEWEHQAIYELLSANREIPKKAYTLVKTHEPKFIRSMQSLLIQGSQQNTQEWITMVLRLFAAIIHYDEQDPSYPNRVSLLIALLNAVPNDSRVIESLFALVPSASQYQLTMEEFDRVVAGCSPDVLAIGGASPSLMKYLQEYILSLTPKKLNSNTINLLMLFQRTSTTLPADIVNLVNSWVDMNTFLANQTFDDKKLRNIERALASLVPLLQQRGQNIWQTFIEELAPYLTTLIEAEYQLQIVLNVFEGANVVRAWDLLNFLAARAGATFTENQNLSRLFPYVIVGIREYIRSGQPKNALDTYLQTLFVQVSDNALGDVDKAISARVWAEPIQIEWKGWRERSKRSFGDRVKSVLPFQQQRPPTGPQSDQAQSAYLPHNPPSPTWSPAEHLPIKGTFPQKAANAPAIDFQIIVSTQEMKHTITVSSYQALWYIWVQVLQYWTRMLSNKPAQSRTKAITNEINTTLLLLEELQKLSTTTISDKLVQYYAEDILINDEVEQLRKTREEPFLNPENHIKPRLDEFRDAVGGIRVYQDLCNRYPEQAYIKILKKLILRYHFLQYKENDWEKWLKGKRKHLAFSIEYPESIQK